MEIGKTVKQTNRIAVVFQQEHKNLDKMLFRFSYSPKKLTQNKKHSQTTFSNTSP